MSKILLERFNKFWALHPARNGRKVGKPEARKKFLKLSDKDSILIIQATKNYRNSKDVKNGIGIRDPHRFIKDSKGNERWREYIQEIPQKPRSSSEKTFSTPEERERMAENMRKGIPMSLKQAMAKTIAEIKKKK